MLTDPNLPIHLFTINEVAADDDLDDTVNIRTLVFEDGLMAILIYCFRIRMVRMAVNITTRQVRFHIIKSL